MKLAIAVCLSLCAGLALAFEGQNAYGPGVHKDAYGRAYSFEDRQGRRVDPGRVNINGYGLGVHQDEYGRPLKARTLHDGADVDLYQDD